MTRMRRRTGFTLIELLVVMVIVGIVFVLALPRLDALVEKNAVLAAKRQLQSYIVVARAAAIRRGYASQFRLSNSSMWVTTSSSTGALSTVRDSITLSNTQKVSVTKSDGGTADSIVFNARGFSSDLSSHTYVLTRGSTKDSLCVTKLGMISKCGL